MSTETAPLRPQPKRTASPAWAERYSDRHRLVRITRFPAGVREPGKVRIYARRDHHVLQWWDPQVRRTLSDRVEGDLIDALARAREIDRRLTDRRASGHGQRRLGHEQLVQAYVADLTRRADAGQLSPGTVDRYRSALGHYRSYAGQPSVSRQWPWAQRVDREFALAFAAWLDNLLVAANGHAKTRQRAMRGQGFVLDAVRAMYEWAADPHCGALLADHFHSPFRRATIERRKPTRDLLGEPDITVDMVAAMFRACDGFQLRLFVPLLFYGLRASEPIFLMHEQMDGRWLNAACVPELAYLTKGQRNKRLPLLPEIAKILAPPLGQPTEGLMFLRRGVVAGIERPPLLGAALGQLIAVFQTRCAKARHLSAQAKRTLRDEVVRDAGGLNYKLIQSEFHRLARRLDWPADATLKDLRHLFNTAMANAGMPERERRYLMGQSQGRDAIVSYTHLNRLAEHHCRAAQGELLPVLEVMRERTA